MDSPDRKVKAAEAKAWCDANGGIAYFETSAKDNIDVALAFEAAARVVKERTPTLNIEQPDTIDLRGKSSGCCSL